MRHPIQLRSLSPNILDIRMHPKFPMCITQSECDAVQRPRARQTACYSKLPDAPMSFPLGLGIQMPNYSQPKKRRQNPGFCWEERFILEQPPFPSVLGFWPSDERRDESFAPRAPYASRSTGRPLRIQAFRPPLMTETRLNLASTRARAPCAARISPRS